MDIDYSTSRSLNIAATAAETNMELCSSNAKHFKPIRDLKLNVFRP